MPWARFDDGFDDDPDVRMLSDQAVAAHVCATTWSSRHLTDGFVPVTALLTLRVTQGETLKELCSACIRGHLPFWTEVEGGYQIRSYLKYNPSKAQVLAEREANAARVGRHREGKRNGVGNGVTNGDVTHAPVPVPVPLKNTHNTRETETDPWEFPASVMQADTRWEGYMREQLEFRTGAQTQADREFLAAEKDPKRTVSLAIRSKWKLLRTPFEDKPAPNGKPDVQPIAEARAKLSGRG
jgi:hypothetical protein